MNRVINGLSYDTAKAKPIADWANGYYANDLDYCEETLYRTAKGAYFVVGWGGPRSKYSKCGGEGLKVLTEKEALKWCENHDVDGGIIEEHFDVAEA